MLPVLLQTFSNVRTAPEFLVQMEQFGLLDAVLPFILIFAVIFTVLRKSGALGDKKNIHMLVALVISFYEIPNHLREQMCSLSAFVFCRVHFKKSNRP